VTTLILAIDTTSEFGSIALVRGDQVLEEIEVHAPDGFAHVLYGEIAALLGRAGVSLDQIDCFAAASGPGSFTGVRVGLACIKGLAEAKRKPAMGVSNLQALSTFGTTPQRAVVLDARRGEVYAAVYDDAGQAAMPEVVTKLAAWRESLGEGPMEFVESGRRALAAAVGRIAFDKYRRGEASAPEALDANYVRRSDAELFWKE
jgi:tRNA threonylcarbamoyladenosine biosynthesis protein TsaB